MADLGIFASSEDPQKLADTVKGILVGLSGLIILVAGYFDVPLTQAQVVEVAGQFGAAIGILWTLYGLIKKLFIKTVVKAVVE